MEAFDEIAEGQMAVETQRVYSQYAKESRLLKELNEGRGKVR